MTLEALGRYEEAIAVFEQSVQTVANRGHLGRCYALAGRQTDARRIPGELQAGVGKNGVGAYEIAFIHAALGNKNEAFRWLDLTRSAIRASSS